MKKNRVPLIVGGVLVVLFAIGAAVLGSSGNEQPKSVAEQPESARALVIPANQRHTVVIPPCNTPVEQTRGDAERGRGTPGATTFELPAEGDIRTVLVPHCQPGTGATNASGNIPSAAFVVEKAPAANQTEGAFESDGVIAKSQLVLPQSGQSKTIIVPPCGKATKGEDAVLQAERGSEVVVAGRC
jgi:hypothetical protein